MHIVFHHFEFEAKNGIILPAWINRG
jgi:hypothetical protein